MAELEQGKRGKNVRTVLNIPRVRLQTRNMPDRMYKHPISANISQLGSTEKHQYHRAMGDVENTWLTSYIHAHSPRIDTRWNSDV
jgi:hypothetical protein